MSTWTRTTKAVNSKPLFEQISEFAEGLMEGSYLIWGSDTQRISLAEVIGEYLEERFTEGSITHWKVMCDARNNRIADMDQGIYYLTIQYKQTNCLNTTEIVYKIQDDGDNVLDLTV